MGTAWTVVHLVARRLIRVNAHVICAGTCVLMGIVTSVYFVGRRRVAVLVMQMLCDCTLCMHVGTGVIPWTGVVQGHVCRSMVNSTLVSVLRQRDDDCFGVRYRVVDNHTVTLLVEHGLGRQRGLRVGSIQGESPLVIVDWARLDYMPSCVYWITVEVHQVLVEDCGWAEVVPAVDSVIRYHQSIVH